ncbi:MAG: RNA polymerase sigma factor [Chloroflexota bacterium]|nr:RNA polymerase sigma factor [Chloroflexota bacterium]
MIEIETAALHKYKHTTHQPWQTSFNTEGFRVDAALEAVRPRLLSQAAAYGIPGDAIEDVVQEALVEAWLHITTLRCPSSFDAWLYGICRNMCLRWSTMHKRALQRHTQGLARWLIDPDQQEELLGKDIIDGQALDPADFIISQDLRHLLGQALGHLSTEYQRAIELYYLAEIPQRETAVRLGLTISALEARLYRARRQLRQILERNFHADLVAFGLSVNSQPALDWHEARVRCRTCGYHQIVGSFEALPRGGLNFRTRCPGCNSERETHGLIPLGGLRSVKPALKRSEHWIIQHLAPRLPDGWHTCPWCGLFAQMLSTHVQETAGTTELMVELHCLGCAARTCVWAWKLLHSHPDVQRFMVAYPHWVCEAGDFTQFHDQPALCLRFVDNKSGSGLTLYAHPQTLTVLAIIQEQ